jgi:hypothetical protein
MIREIIKISAKENLGYYESQKCKPWFDEGNNLNCSEISGDNLNYARYEASRHFRNKRTYLKDKIKELATNSKNKNISHLCRGINEFMRGY